MSQGNETSQASENPAAQNPGTTNSSPWIRDEDARLTTGGGRYTDDIHFDNEAHMAVVRSPYAAARIASIDTSAAKAMPGVLAVFTGADAREAGLGTIDPAQVLNRPDGTPMHVPPYRTIAEDAVHFIGDIVAVVVAESAHQADDAREAVAVDYEELQPVTDVEAATEPGAPQVWNEVPGNVSFLFEAGDGAATQKAIASAAHKVELTFRISRLTACPMEPRSAVGLYKEGRYTLYTGTQNTHTVRAFTAKQLGGIAGASVGYHLATHGSVIIAEMESQPGYHTTGRSAAFYAETYGNKYIRPLTIASKSFLCQSCWSCLSGGQGRGRILAVRTVDVDTNLRL